MAVEAGLALAFFGAAVAGHCTELDRAPQDIFVQPCPARREPAQCFASIGAVRIEADALDELRHAPLRKAGIGARDAGLGAGEGFLDEADERFIGLAWRDWVGRHHFTGQHRVLQYGDCPYDSAQRRRGTA